MYDLRLLNVSYVKLLGTRHHFQIYPCLRFEVQIHCKPDHYIQNNKKVKKKYVDNYTFLDPVIWIQYRNR